MKEQSLFLVAKTTYMLWKYERGLGGRKKSTTVSHQVQGVSASDRSLSSIPTFESKLGCLKDVFLVILWRIHYISFKKMGAFNTLIWLQIYFFDSPWPRRSKATILHWILLMIADCKERQREYCLQSGINNNKHSLKTQNGWTCFGWGVREHKQKYSIKLSLMGQSPILVTTVNEDSYFTVLKTWPRFPGITNSSPAALLKTGTAVGLWTPKGPCFSSLTRYKITLGWHGGEAAALHYTFSLLSNNRMLQAEMYKNWLVQRGQGEQLRNLFKVRQSIVIATQLWLYLSLTDPFN